MTRNMLLFIRTKHACILFFDLFCNDVGSACLDQLLQVYSSHLSSVAVTEVP